MNNVQATTGTSSAHSKASRISLDDLNVEGLESRDNSMYYKASMAVSTRLGLEAPQPLEQKRAGLWRFWKGPSLDALGKALRIKDAKMLEALAFHSRRYYLWHVLRILASAAVLALVMALGSAGSLGFGAIVSLFHLAADAVAVLSAIVFFLVFITSITILDRLVSRFVAISFEETICISTALSVAIDLCSNQALILPDRKKVLLYRVNYLAEETRALALRYASRYEETQSWSKRHFRKMELFIRERERWIIAPANNTLADLQRDFRSLVFIYITGRYGNCKWQNPVSRSETSQAGQMQRLADLLARLVGVVLPLAIVGFYVWDRDIFQGINMQTISLLLFGWFLLAIDSLLHLGVTSEVIQLAKKLKDLG